MTFPADPNDPNTPVTLTFGYDADGRITRITDGAGQTWTYQYDADTGMLTVVIDPLDGNGNSVQQTLDYSTLMINNRWETYYTDRSGASWTYRFSRKGRLREREGPDGFIETKMTYDTDGNLTSFDDGAGTVITLTWGPVSTLLTLHTPTGGPDSSLAPVWNDVTFAWTQPDPANRPNFWRLEQIADAEGYSTQYLYEDPPDDARATTIVDTPPDPNDPNTPVQVWDGDVSPIPPTGIGHGWRRYWQHPDSGPERAQGIFTMPEQAAPAPDAAAQGLPPYAWRWRFFWVVPLVGGHIGIDYHSASGAVRYVDYGQAPDPNAPTRCSGCRVPWVFVNNRYRRSGAGLLARDCASCRPQPSDWRAGTPCMVTCFENSDAQHTGLPRNWTDQYPQCVRYWWLGWTPGWPLCQWLGMDCNANYSNSNGGAHAALHRCLGRGSRCPDTNRVHPPYGWTRYFAPGWHNRDLTRHTGVCPGYSAGGD